MNCCASLTSFKPTFSHPIVLLAAPEPNLQAAKGPGLPEDYLKPHIPGRFNRTFNPDVLQFDSCRVNLSPTRACRNRGCRAVNGTMMHGRTAEFFDSEAMKQRD
jgi:hypothetical protein